MPQDTSPNLIENAADLIKAALTHARNVAGKEVRLGADGISIVDAFGTSHEITQGGASVPVPMDEAGKVLGDRNLLDWKSSSTARNWDSLRVFPELGTWVEAANKDGTVSLRPKKAFAPCLEALTEADEEGLARLRSAYDQDGLDVLVICEGETRTREVAAAIMAERSQLGLPTTLSLMPEEDRSYRWREKPAEKDYQGAFDPIAIRKGAPWTVEHVDGHKLRDRLLDLGNDPEIKGSRVFVASDRRHGIHMDRIRQHIEKRARPTLVMQVSLKASKPLASFAISSSLHARTFPDAGFGNAPWDAYADRKEARQKARPPAPKTWHPTTAHVGRAFVEREAPRGYVSGKSLFFHGPVAYSIWDNNPIAVIMDAPDGGKPFIVFGRDPNVSGGKAAIMSMAMGDIGVAAKGDFRKLHLGDLDGVVTLGGKPLKDLPWLFRKDKNEADFPAGAEFDVPGLTRWLAEEHRQCLEGVEKSLKTKYATFNQAHAYRDLARLAGLRDELHSTFGLDLPEYGDAAEYELLAENHSAAAQQRQNDIRDRKRQSAEREDEEPAVGMRM